MLHILIDNVRVVQMHLHGENIFHWESIMFTTSWTQIYHAITLYIPLLTHCSHFSLLYDDFHWSLILASGYVSALSWSLETQKGAPKKSLRARPTTFQLLSTFYSTVILYVLFAEIIKLFKPQLTRLLVKVHFKNMFFQVTIWRLSGKYPSM